MSARGAPSSTQRDSRGYPRYWDEERETMKSSRRDQAILERLKEQLHYVYSELPFYRRLYDDHGVKPDDVQSLEDFTTKIPVITKKMLVADQEANPVFGSYTKEFPQDQIARIHGSSGTSGKPTLYGVSQRDWDRSADVHAMAQWCAGIRPDDLFQVGFPFSLFFGGWGVIQGAERIGATLFPLGVIDSERHLELLFRLQATAFSATPSYCLHLLSIAERMGLDVANGPVRHLLVGGEPGGSLPGTKELIEAGWGATCADAGSTSEMYPFQTNVGCEEGQGTHLITDEVYTEIADRDDSNAPAPEGSRGAIIYTHLWRESQPMIRFWAGDETWMTRETCSCGRTYPRLPEGVLGRLDDMLVIRGVNIYPSMVEMALRSVDDLGAEFVIQVEKRGALDEVQVLAELGEAAAKAVSDLPANDAASRRKAIIKEAETRLRQLTNIRVPVALLDPGALPATTFKARRVVDKRGRVGGGH